ncbi:MAG: hypothetical protein ACREVR_16315, partial [Burkholderiales bacterium]
EPGDIVYFLSDAGFMVHRVVYRKHRNPADGWLLTLGDNCFAPDAPVSAERVLGTVVAARAGNDWRIPPPPEKRPAVHRFFRAAAVAAMICALWISVPLAYRLATALRALERIGRSPVGRLLRRLRLLCTTLHEGER